MQGQLMLKVMALLAFVQGLGGFLRASNWFQTGADLFGEGLLLLPLVGAVAILRGLFGSAVALFYVLFAVGALLGKRWARWVGLSAAIVNLLMVLNAVVQGIAGFGQVIVWSVIPAVLVIYLFSAAGRKALTEEI